jgi:hypothetical protein
MSATPLSTALGDAERIFFRNLNHLLAPMASQGWFSPTPLTAGLSMLEVTGRKTGQRHRVPLLAAPIGGGQLLFATVRGQRSQWVRNLCADPQLRYWLDGAAHPGRAVMVAGGTVRGEPSGAAAILAPVLIPATLAGWAFAIVRPA